MNDMKFLKFWFTIVPIIMIIPFIFLVFDAIVLGLIYAFVYFFNKVLAFEIFKWGIIVLFSLQVVSAIPVMIKSVREELKK